MTLPEDQSDSVSLEISPRSTASRRHLQATLRHLPATPSKKKSHPPMMALALAYLATM
jgi:hypothetical protein